MSDPLKSILARLNEMQREAEARQRKRMDERFKDRKQSPTTADADFCYPNDAIESEITEFKQEEK